MVATGPRSILGMNCLLRRTHDNHLSNRDEAKGALPIVSRAYHPCRNATSSNLSQWSTLFSQKPANTLTVGLAQIPIPDLRRARRDLRLTIDWYW